MDIRRSSRVNKGTHSKRDIHDVYYQIEESPAKKQKVTSDDEAQDKSDHDKSDQDKSDQDGQVRCDPCGTTQANYDEETDQGGTMIECDNCNTWQHARCMGFFRQRDIPKAYFCNRCQKEEQREVEVVIQREGQKEVEDGKKGVKEAEKETQKDNLSEKEPVEASKSGKLDVVGLLTKQDKTRGNVAKALVNVVVKTEPGLQNGPIWAIQLEEAIHTWSSRTTDKKYIEKSRSVMALLKKPAVLARLVSGDLSASDFTILPAEEIDPDLKQYAEKVRQESIKRSVLTVEDTSSQRIRRTHKGEEIVENSAHAVDEYMNIAARDIDHRKFKDESPPSEPVSRPSVPPTTYQIQDDDDDHYNSTEDGPKEAGNENLGVDSDGDSDDEMALILNSKKNEEKEAVAEAPKQNLPPTIPVRFWSGEVVFPDFAAFQAQADFVSCTHYQQPCTSTTVSLHNRAMRVCKDLMERKTYQIEGRLDRAKADPYLAKVAQSRDFFVVRLKTGAENPSYSKIFDYLQAQNKVGVLSGRAHFVKDSYVFALGDSDVPEYLSFARPLDSGLYILFVVKKDYVPVGKGILKKRPESSTIAPASYFPSVPGSVPGSMPGSAASASSLDSILSKLEGSVPAYPEPVSHLPPKPVPLDIQQMSANLSPDQLNYLSRIMQENPHVQNNPQALLSLLQSMQ